MSDETDEDETDEADNSSQGETSANTDAVLRISTLFFDEEDHELSLPAKRIKMDPERVLEK